MTLRREPTWGGVATPAAAPVEASDASPPPPARAVNGSGAPQRTPTEHLESEVYIARDVHGETRAQLRRTLAKARSSMSEPAYRRALELARDSVLLSVEECVRGALAMEWEPMPRPEFSLATIEAAVAEQERSEPGPRAG